MAAIISCVVGVADESDFYQLFLFIVYALILESCSYSSLFIAGVAVDVI